MDSVAERDDDPVCAATENSTEPGPVPLEPVVIVTQPASAPAVQVQLWPADTVTNPLPPDAPNANVATDRE
jgi:hypothetical protein